MFPLLTDDSAQRLVAVAHHSNDNTPHMRRMPVPIEIQSLPGPQHKLLVRHGDGEVVRGEDRARVRGHVVGAFGVVQVDGVGGGEQARGECLNGGGVPRGATTGAGY